MLLKILCLFGIHDYQIISSTLGFGSAGGVQRLQCKRCGYTKTKKA